MNRVIENSVSNTAFFAYALSKNSAVQAMFSEPPVVSYENKRQMDEYMSQNGPFLFLNTGLINVVFLDGEYTPFYSTYFSGNDENVYDYLRDNPALRSISRNGGVTSINRFAQSIDAPTFLYAIDVYDTGLYKDGNRRMGTIVMLCSLEKYRKELAAISNLNINYSISDKGTVLLHDGEPQGEPQFSISMPVASSQWQLHASLLPSYTPTALLSNGWLPLITVTLALLSIPLFMGVFQRYLTRPIENLLGEISTLRPNTRLQGDSYFEIATISNYINMMLDQNDEVSKQLHGTKDELQQMEILRARTELSALQSQINPHFLYNTLECVRSIAQYNRIDSIQEIVSAMADLFRYTIKGSEIVRVRDEIFIIEEYLKIVAVRFSGRYTSKVQIDPGILDFPIQKMILQPLVENAVFHGLEKRRTGEVVITGVQEGGNILFTVHDNGGSFPPETLKYIVGRFSLDVERAPEEGIGLLNIHRKIQLYYGSDYGLHIESSQESGTLVTVTLPVLDQAGQN